MANKDIAKKVVDRIVEMIEQGQPLPWVKPWGKDSTTITVVDGYKTVTVPASAWNRKGVQYKGANTYLPAGEYITFAQAQKEGGKVRKGAKGWPVVFWKFFEKETGNLNPDGTKEKETIPMLKYYTVFRIEDVEGLEQKHHPAPTTYTVPITHTEKVKTTGRDSLNQTAEDVIADYISRAGNGFKVIRDQAGDRAFYSPAMDYVQVPTRGQFPEMTEFYSTLFHELAHSTGHKTRLNRFTGKAANAAFGSQEYSREELVAEATAASVLNALGMEEANTFRNSAAYIKSWASHIQNDPMTYITAMTRAQAAFDLITGADVATNNEDEEA